MLAAAQGALASAVGPSWAVGDRPIWEYAVVQDLILAQSLEGGPTPLTPPPALTLASLLESMFLMKQSLRALFESEAGVQLKPVIGRVHSAFERAIELTKAFSNVKDTAGFFEMLTNVVSQVKALTPGSSFVFPGGFKGGLLMYVLHMDTFEECTLAVCTAGEGLHYHPSRIDPATGATQFNTPLLLRHVPMHRVRDGSVWFVLLKAVLLPDAKHTVGFLYQTIFPFLNSRPVLANLASSAANGAANGAASGAASGAANGDGSSGGGEVGGVETRWWTPQPRGDPYGYDLTSLAATVALQLGSTGGMGGQLGMGPPGGMGAMSGMGGVGVAAGPVYSGDGLELLLKHQLLLLATKDLSMAGNAAEAVVTPTVLELLSRSTRRLSAHSPRLAAGAATLAPQDLATMQSHVSQLTALISEARAITSTMHMPLSPPVGEVHGTALFPNLDKVAASPNVEALAGDLHEPPILMPVALSSVPNTVTTFADVSNALQRAAEVCTLLGNQVRNLPISPPPPSMAFAHLVWCVCVPSCALSAA